MSEFKCDFCSAPGVAWRYPAESFLAYIAADIAGESVGDWAACPQCHGLIASGDREALTERSIASLIGVNPEMADYRDELKKELRSLHARFFGHRRGEAVEEVW